MKRFFKNFFKRNKTSQEPFLNDLANSRLDEPQLLDLLSNAIYDTGSWSWWTADLPNVVQIEFVQTRLYLGSSQNSQPPSTQIAIQFRNPKSVSFLTRHGIQRYNKNWFKDLHDDKIRSLGLSYENFSFTDDHLITTIFHECKYIETIHGYKPTDPRFQSEKYKLAFWADDYGFAIAADEIRLLTKKDTIELDEIPAINSRWWEYWRRYWDLKSTKAALPKDLLCETTIPVRNE